MTIQVTVRYFAKFRDLAGCAEEVLDTDALSAEALFAELAPRLALTEPRQHCKVAINDTLVDWSAKLRDGDSMLLFPPVAGG